MNFYEARTISKQGRHVRREPWTDKWLIVWRGVWWCLSITSQRVVKATDFGKEDLLANDWTTMPAALASCPIGGGSTGGGSALPPPGSSPVSPSLPGGSPPFIPPLFPPQPPPPPGAPPIIPPPERPTCEVGTVELTMIPSCPDGMACEVTASGISPGNYSVTFTVGGITVSGGILTGPSGSASAVVSGLEDFAGLPVGGTVKLKGIGEGNPCRGRTLTASALEPIFCPICASPSANLIVALTGIAKAAGSDPSGYITGADPNGARNCSWDAGLGGWTCNFTSGHFDDGMTEIDIDWAVAVFCFDGRYTLTLTNNLFVGGGFYGGVGGAAPAGVAQTNYSTGIFQSGSATVTVAP